jgi:hypothetical protein
MLQQRYRMEFVMAALAPPGTQSLPEKEEVDRELAALSRRVRMVWETSGCDNGTKETLWRLMLNGVRGAGGHDRCMSGPCPCGALSAAPPPRPPRPLTAWVRENHTAAVRWHSYTRRLHVFWDCPVAQSVVKQIAAGLPQGMPLTCADVWLLRVPAAAEGFIHPGVWAMVCTFAIHAMEKGRAYLYALFMDRQADEHPILREVRASNRAAEWFWHLLQDFALLTKRVPATWKNLSSSHPFLRLVQGGTPAQLVLDVPATLLLPAHLD